MEQLAGQPNSQMSLIYCCNVDSTVQRLKPQQEGRAITPTPFRRDVLWENEDSAEHMVKIICITCALSPRRYFNSGVSVIITCVCRLQCVVGKEFIIVVSFLSLSILP